MRERQDVSSEHQTDIQIIRINTIDVGNVCCCKPPMFLFTFFFFTKNPWLELGEDHVLTQKQTRPERSAIKTTEWVTAYKCWNAVLSSGLLLGTYIATTNPNTSKHESQLICMYCKCDMTYICRNVDMIHIQIWTYPCIKHKKPTVYPGYWAIQLCV